MLIPNYSAQDLRTEFDFSGAKNISDLRIGLHKARTHWAEFSAEGMAADLLDRQINTDTIYQAGVLRLQRFITELDLNRANTVGERLVRPDGEVLYLKTYRLAQDQARRAWWLTQLSRHDRHLEATAASLKMTTVDLVKGLDKAGFGYLLKRTKMLKDSNTC